MSRVLCLGECMVEMSSQADGSYAMGFAGDTFNTAWYLRRLLPERWEVGYGTCVGDDAVSGRMAEFISASGVDTRALRKVPGRTVGLYMIELSEGERTFSYWRGQSAARCLGADREWLSAILENVDAIYFSGITLAILPPDDRTAFCEVVAAARARGITVAFDTNLRPRLWDSPDAMRQGITQGASVADIVLPSFDEDSELFGDADAAATIARYRATGARIVAVKNGAQTLHIWTDEEGMMTFDPVPAARLVDTTAAGDSFGAGFVAALLQGQGPEAAAHQAMALSARVVGARGALVEPGEAFSTDTTIKPEGGPT